MVFACLTALGWWLHTPALDLDTALGRREIPDPAAGRERIALRVSKAEGRLEVLLEGMPVASCPVAVGSGRAWPWARPEALGGHCRPALGPAPGAKGAEGDCRTPEGEYRLVEAFRPSRATGRFAGLDYPNARDRRFGRTGSEIGIHALPPAWAWTGRAATWLDWTGGCIALPAADVAELARWTGPGTQVVIDP